jgi:hypothetical protein
MSGGQLDLIHELEKAGAITPTGLSLSDPNMPFEQWQALCRMLGGLRSATQWWIGDLLNFGEGAYGEKYAQAMDDFGLEYSTLTNYAYVARSVARRRRRVSLSFAHHRLVAALEPKEQSKWLKKAEEGDWTRQQMHDNMKAIAPGGDPDPAPAPADPPLTVGDAARAVWNQAQKNGGVYEVPAEPMLVLASTLGIETA